MWDGPERLSWGSLGMASVHTYGIARGKLSARRQDELRVTSCYWERTGPELPRRLVNPDW